MWQDLRTNSCGNPNCTAPRSPSKPMAPPWDPVEAPSGAKAAKVSSLDDRLDRPATVVVELVQRGQLINIAIRVAQTESAVGEKTDVLALLHAELDRAAVGLHLPLLKAETNVDLVDARDPRNKDRAGQGLLDRLPQVLRQAGHGF